MLQKYCIETTTVLPQQCIQDASHKNIGDNILFVSDGLLHPFFATATIFGNIPSALQYNV